jgi:transcriptional regulator with XRE-family HTH domain
MSPEQRRREIAELLRSRRAALLPEEAGLALGARRRVRGLRREEVAELAGVSPSWYTWLEQGREVHPSSRTLQRIAAALRLSHEESTYLALLAGLPLDQLSLATQAAPTAASRPAILNCFKAVPAVLYNRRFDVVAANAPARGLYGPDLDSEVGWERNALWRFFMDPERRRLYPDDATDPGICNLIEVLRMNWAAGDERDGIGELVDELRKCREFDMVWCEGRVAMLCTVSGRIQPRNSIQAIPVQYTRLAVHGDCRHVIEALIPEGGNAAASLEQYLDCTRSSAVDPSAVRAPDSRRVEAASA